MYSTMYRGEQVPTYRGEQVPTSKILVQIQQTHIEVMKILFSGVCVLSPLRYRGQEANTG